MIDRNNRVVLAVSLGIFFVAFMAASSRGQDAAQTILEDDFENGFSLDWQEFGPEGSTFEVEDGVAAITSTDEEFFVGIELHDFGPNDFSVLTQLQVPESRPSAFQYVYAYELHPTTGAERGLWGGISLNNLSFSVGDVLNGTAVTRDTEEDVLGELSTDLVNLRVDFRDSALRLKAWPEGGVEPQLPQMVWFSQFGPIDDRDRISLGLNPASTLEPASWTDFKIEELDPSQSDDLDFDGQIDADDLDLICERVRRGTSPNGRDFDLDGDSIVSLDDVGLFLTRYGFLPGDADLSGEVDFSDFLELSASFGGRAQRTDLWSKGDFNCDNRINFPDFLILSANYTGEGQAAAVPEPSAGALPFLGLVGLLAWRRRRIAAQ